MQLSLNTQKYNHLINILKIHVLEGGNRTYWKNYGQGDKVRGYIRFCSVLLIDLAELYVAYMYQPLNKLIMTIMLTNFHPICLSHLIHKTNQCGENYYYILNIYVHQ